jgi:hypothetical protein
MDNQTNSVNKIICRKCGGPHFTIKCGKSNTPNEVTPTLPNKENKPIAPQQELTKERHHESTERFERSERRQYFKHTYRVKLADLPIDMTEQEMMELTCDWGHIAKIRVINYDDNSVSYIDFGYEDEADYFVKALDRTPFDHFIITAQRVESN